jgi:hypothetical protein
LAQARNLQNILTVTGIAEKHLDSHLGWATFTFADLVHKRLGGLNPFDNAQKVYQGSEASNASLLIRARSRSSPTIRICQA